MAKGIDYTWTLRLGLERPWSSTLVLLALPQGQPTVKLVWRPRRRKSLVGELTPPAPMQVKAMLVLPLDAAPEVSPGIANEENTNPPRETWETIACYCFKPPSFGGGFAKANWNRNCYWEYSAAWTSLKCVVLALEPGEEGCRRAPRACSWRLNEHWGDSSRRLELEPCIFRVL